VKEKLKKKKIPPGANRMPENSVFYNKLVPILLGILGIIMVALILIAAAILLGVL
jgi:hypothetical protein